MEATERNSIIAQEISKTLADYNCTVDEAASILAYVNREIRRTATVTPVKPGAND